MAEKTQERPLLASSRSRMGGNSFFCLFALLGALKRVLEASLAFAAFAHARARDSFGSKKRLGLVLAETIGIARSSLNKYIYIILKGLRRVVILKP